MQSGVEAFPLFSPSQMSHNKETVLHSVFSPSCGGAAIARLDCKTTEAGDDSHGRKEYGSEEHGRDGNATHVVSCDLVSKSGKNNRALEIREKAVGNPQPCPDNVEEANGTADGGKNPKCLMTHSGSALRVKTHSSRTDGIPRSVTFRSDTLAARECTPHNTDCLNSPSCSGQNQRFDEISSPDLFMSPISVADDCSRSQAMSIKTWHSVPVEMLNIDVVANCKCEHQLENIISALTEASPAKYPSLLRMATARLRTLRDAADKRPQDKNRDSQVSNQIDGLHLDLSCSGLVGSVIEPNEESSLVLNISTSMSASGLGNGKRVGHVRSHPAKDLAEKHNEHDLTHFVVEDPKGLGRNSALEEARGGETEQNPSYFELKENLATLIAAHSSLSAELDDVILERDNIQRDLETQTKICRDLESKIREQNNELCAKISSLERAKDEAQADIATLEETLVSSSAKAREVAMKLTMRTEEVNRLSEALQKAKDDAAKERVAHQNLQKGLKDKIDELSRKLAVQEERAAEKVEVLESKLKRDFEAVSGQQKVQIAKLSSKLTEARHDIDKLKKKNNELSLEMANSTTGSKDKSLLQRYNKVVTQAKSTEEAASAMAKALAVSESKLVAAEESRDECERKCSKLIEASSNLKSENEELSDLLAQVSRELASSDVYVDKLLDELEALKEGELAETRKMKEEMVHREKMFRSEIHQLQTKVKSQESWVSMEQYRKILSEAKTLAKLRSCMESEIKELCKKNHRLEQIIKTPEQPGTPLSTLPNAESTANGYSIATEALTRKTVSVLVENNSVDKGVSPPKKVTPLSTTIPGRSLARMTAVRAAGGRAALSAKLKKTRGSALRRSHHIYQPIDN